MRNKNDAMQNEAVRPGPGASRRRNPRASGKVAAQRNYASENDMPTSSKLDCDQPRFPQTPRKRMSGSPVPATSVAQHNSKPRSRNKNRPDNIALSPDSTRLAGPTSLQSSIPAPKSSTTTAFAGATFHASPAPSALPMPRFHTKVSESPGVQDKSKPSEEKALSTAAVSMPTPSRITPNPPAQDSPLEFMFKADREEKERARRASMANPQQMASLSTTGSPSPVPQPFASSVPSRPHQRLQNPAPSTAKADGYLGHIGQPIGPSFSAPFHERIRAARGSPSSTPEKSQSLESPTDRSEALKRLLFASPSSKDRVTKTAPTTISTNDHTPEIQGNVQHDVSDPSRQDERDARVLAMEDNLRRLLKMGS